MNTAPRSCTLLRPSARCPWWLSGRRPAVRARSLLPSSRERRLCTRTAQNCTTQPCRRSEPKTGRNDTCPCGSGRKYKRRCLGKSAAPAAA
ncbi:MAG: SEC-C metal-binding domain-containing protein [Bryobacteraceae bacterium]